MEFHVRLFNENVNQYFTAQDLHSGNKHKLCATENGIKARLDAINAITAQLTELVNENQSRKLHVDGVAANGGLQRDPYISIFPEGISAAKNDICVVFGFKDDEEVSYVGCRNNNTLKYWWWKNFREAARIGSVKEQQDVMSSRIGQDEHLAFPVSVFKRGAFIEKSALATAMESALKVYDEAIKELDCDETVFKHTNDGAIEINDSLLNSFASRVKALESDILRFETLQKDLQTKYGAVAQDIEQLRNDLNIANQLIKDVRSKADDGVDKAVKAAQDKADAFIQQKTGELTKAIDELNDLKALSAIGCLAKKFEEKQAQEKKSLCWKSITFYACLASFIVLGVVALCLCNSLVNESLLSQYGWMAYFVVLPKTIIRLSPFYIPLLWATATLVVWLPRRVV